jgi:hypothetical protein
MIRISEGTASFGQLRVENDVNQYSTEAALRKAGMRPSLAPYDGLPMGIKTSWVNPGEQVLMNEGEITPLTPLGPEATNVFPGVYPAPADTQNIDFEDRIPRIQDRGDQILRSRSGYRGPAQYWKYGGMSGDDPLMFYRDPSEVAYQAYPGPFMGQAAPALPCSPKEMLIDSVLMTGIGAALGFFGAPMVKDKMLRQGLGVIALIMGGIGTIGLVHSAGSALSKP